MMVSTFHCLFCFTAPFAVVAVEHVFTCSDGKMSEKPDALVQIKRPRRTGGSALLQSQPVLEKVSSAAMGNVAAHDEAAEEVERATEVAEENVTTASSSKEGNNVSSSETFSKSNLTSNQTERWGCKKQRESCWTDYDCCYGMECLGLQRWECGHKPGLVGEICDMRYACDEHLLCHHGRCTEYNDVLLWGSKGSCRAGSSPGKIKVMTYNIFLISCIVDGYDGKKKLKCQPEKEQRVRIQKLMQWMKERDEDVVVVQELFSLRDEVIDGMAAAGFCHYVSTPFDQDGSGMATFSKHPIKTFDFVDWFDWSGQNSKTHYDLEALADKGVMYAQIEKHGHKYHVFNTHTQSNSNGDQHEIRMGQYTTIKKFAQRAPRNELILFGGDFNEDKFNKKNGPKYFKEMLQELDAEEPKYRGNLKYTLDEIENEILQDLWAWDNLKEKFRERLDYVLISNRGKKPRESYCEILKPQWPKNCAAKECMLSDHFPNTCTFL